MNEMVKDMTYFSRSLPAHYDQHSVWERIGNIYNVWCQRQALKRLDTAALQDIGISQKQAEEEADRAFWDIPAR